MPTLDEYECQQCHGVFSAEEIGDGNENCPECEWPLDDFPDREASKADRDRDEARSDF